MVQSLLKISSTGEYYLTNIEPVVQVKEKESIIQLIYAFNYRISRMAVIKRDDHVLGYVFLDEILKMLVG